MIAFEIYINGVVVCTAGLEGYSVLTAILTSHVVDPKSDLAKLMPPSEVKDKLDLSVGGLDTVTNKNLNWLIKKLSVGDEVHIKIIETGSVDSPKN